MNLNDFFPMVTCVNLLDRKDRWHDAQTELGRVGIKCDRFDAFKDINPVRGCLMSHLAILREAQERQENVFIFEDDVLFIDEDYENTISQALTELDPNFDMFYLGANICNKIHKVSPHVGKLTHAQATHAYGVSAKFLGKLIPMIENFYSHIDLLYGYEVVPNNNCYITIPLVAIQRASFSNIENRIVDYEWMKARYEFCLTNH